MRENILNSIDIINEKSDYWFVRTDGGLYFDTFFSNGFIGIGWDDILLRDLHKPIEEVKAKIANAYVDIEDLDERYGKMKATDIYNKVLRFKNLRRNDVIIIPSENSDFLSFGLIADDAIYEDANESHGCPYIKRRKVNWINEAPKPFDTLDNAFYKIRKSRHSISNVNDYADYIDSEMYNVYKKEDKSHFVINVNKEGEINWLELANTLLEMHQMMAEINEVFGLNESVIDGSIQIAIQSPGLFNLGQKGIALILLATALGASSCSQVKGNMNEADKVKLEQLQQNKGPQLDSIKNKLQSMDVRL